MTNRDVIITSSKVCAQCGRKLYNGYRAIAITKRDKIKAYTCSDVCARGYGTHHSTAPASARQ